MKQAEKDTKTIVWRLTMTIDEIILMIVAVSGIFFGGASLGYEIGRREDDD